MGFPFYRAPEGAYIYHWTSELKDDSRQAALEHIQLFTDNVDPSDPVYWSEGGYTNMGAGLYTCANPIKARKTDLFGGQLVMVRLKSGCDFASTSDAYVRPTSSAATLNTSGVTGIIYPWHGSKGALVLRNANSVDEGGTKIYFALKNAERRLLDITPMEDGDWRDKAIHYGLYYIPLSSGALLRDLLPAGYWFDSQGSLTAAGAEMFVQADLHAIKHALAHAEVTDNIWGPYEKACKSLGVEPPDDPSTYSFLFRVAPPRNSKEYIAWETFLVALGHLDEGGGGSGLSAVRERLYSSWRARKPEQRKAGETYLRALWQMEQSKDDVRQFGSWPRAPKN